MHLHPMSLLAFMSALAGTSDPVDIDTQTIDNSPDGIEDPLIVSLRAQGKTGRKARRAAASIRRRMGVRS